MSLKEGGAQPRSPAHTAASQHMTSAESGPKLAAGHIKWFDPVKGFGFILADGGGPDILLHANVLRSFGQSSIADGSRVEVEAIPTARGLQATAVLSVEPPADDHPRPLAELAGTNGAALEQLAFLPARVKWFDKAKGFGFASVFGKAADVFLHIDVLRHGGFADLTSGEAVALRIVEGNRGLMAVQVAGWDRGLDDAGSSGSGSDPSGTGPDIESAPPVSVFVEPPVSPIGAEAVATPPLLAAEQP